MNLAGIRSVLRFGLATSLAGLIVTTVTAFAGDPFRPLRGAADSWVAWTEQTARHRNTVAHSAGAGVRRVAWHDADCRGCDSGGGACGDCRGPGTLFRWSAGGATGGPDLDAPLVTDRPDFTEASVTVGCGVAQLEAGYTYIYDDDLDESLKTHSIGEPLLRIGVLADWLELRIGWIYTDEEATTGTPQGTLAEDLSGGEDLLLGLKLALTPQDGVLPEMAIVPQMTVPTGGSDRTADEVLPGVNWLYSWELSDEWSLAGSTQVNRSLDEVTGRSYAEFAQSITVGRSLTDELGVYGEWFAFFPHSADTAQVEHFFNGGFTYLLSDDVQFDIRAGKGLNDAAADWFVGTGLSVRHR